MLAAFVAIGLGFGYASAEKLVILHTNDTHSQIDPDSPDNLGGVLRRKAIIDSVRGAEKNVLLVDAGDVVQGTLYYNLYRGLVEEKVMNNLGYDLRILGNHEFDNGMDSLAKYLKLADAELLSTNYDLSESALKGMFKPYAIKEIDGKKIAFIAINLKPEGMISEGNYDGVKYLDAVKAANSAAWWLKHIGKADKVIAITHIGYDPAMPPGDKMLAESSEDIDIIIGGHSHTLLDPAHPKKGLEWEVENADGEEVLITQAMKQGKYVGKIEIDLDSDETPKYSLIKVDSRYDRNPDAGLEALLKPYRNGVDSLNHVKVGKLAMKMERESPEMFNFVSDFIMRRAGELSDNVDFALVNKGGIRHGLDKGPVYEGEIISMMPFYNYVTVIDILGSDLIPAFNQMAKVGGQALGGDIDVTFDPEDSELEEILINGQPLIPEQTYRVATIDYLAKGGDYMPTLARGEVVAKSKSVLYDDMLRYLRGPMKGKTLKPSSVLKMHPGK